MLSFAEQLSGARKAAGMTQEDLAKAVHVTRSAVSSWERGRTRPNLETLQLLADVLSFDFISGDSPADTEDDSVIDNTAAQTIEKAALQETELAADNPQPSAPAATKHRLPLFLGIGVMLAAVCLALFVLPSLRSGIAKPPVPDVDPSLLLLEEPALFTREWFQSGNIQYEGEPYLELSTPLTVDKAHQPYPLWIFSLIFEEVTGRPFKPEQLDSYFFYTNVGYQHFWTKADALWAAESGNAWRDDGQMHITDMKGIGYIVYGYDQWGRKMSFRAYLDFTQAE